MYNCKITFDFLNKNPIERKAKETLSKAIEILDECGADGWVERYKKEMTEL